MKKEGGKLNKNIMRDFDFKKEMTSGGQGANSKGKVKGFIEKSLTQIF